TAEAGIVSLGDLPGLPNIQANAVSADGRVVVGNAYYPGKIEAFLWTPEAGMVGFGSLPGGANIGEAYSISSNGRFVAGSGTDATGHEEGVLWDMLTGTTTDLGRPAEFDFGARAFAIDDTGTVAVGTGGGLIVPRDGATLWLKGKGN